MAKTRHIHKRMSQRGINSRLVDLVTQFGVDHGDKCILTRKNTEALIGAVDTLRSQLIEVQSKGGLVVVEQGDYQITVYSLDSYSRKKAKEGDRRVLH
ncbi:MAG: hypothetical protein ACTH3S_11820 [Marinobacter sp.]|uniref:hypothetical protein n=1 Tax=Marinobacter sp. TaxID=50741 RepID=UPI003F95F6DB